MALNQHAATLKPLGLAPHPQSDGFTWIDRPETGLKALSANQIRHYNQHGWLKLPQVVSGDALKMLTTAIDACEATEPDSVLTMADGYTLRYGADKLSFSRNLVLRDDHIRAFATGPAMKAIMQDLINERVRLYWDQAVYKKPGEPKEFPYHQDNGYTFVAPQAYVTLWLALTDAVEDNGCPWVIPGLHKHGTLAHENAPYGLEIEGIRAFDDKAVVCPAKAGDAVIFSSLTPHKTGPNLTQTHRKAFILQYIPDGARSYGEGGAINTLTDEGLNPLL